MHRLNGGLNNAAIAFELLHVEGMAAAADQILKAGMAGVAQASRAVQLIDAVLRPTGASRTRKDPFYLSDVSEILRQHATRSGRKLRVGPDMSEESSASTTANVAAASLTRGMALIADAGEAPLDLINTVEDNEPALVIVVEHD